PVEPRWNRASSHQELRPLRRSPRVASFRLRLHEALRDASPRLSETPVLRLSDGFLLRRTVESTETQHEVTRVNADHLALRKSLRDDSERATIVRIVEGRDDDGRRADVEVRVACRKAQAVEHDRLRHRQVNHVEAATASIARAFEPLACLREDAV